MDPDDDLEQEFDADEDVELPPPTLWETVGDLAGGLTALLFLAVAVLALLAAAGLFLGLLTWAAPAILALAGAVLLARYLSRRR